MAEFVYFTGPMDCGKSTLALQLHYTQTDGGREGRVQLRLDTKKGIIAAQLNLTQEHFSRILRELMTSGILEVHGSMLDISDVARLIHLGATGESRKPPRPSAESRPRSSARSRRGP